MWSLLPNQHLEEYLFAYPEINENQSDLILYQNEAYTFFPRHFIRSFPFKHLIFHNDPGWKPQYTNIEFNGELKPEQQEICQPILAYINAPTSLGVAKARPGFGKTVISVYIACKSRAKTLIVLDNNNLVEQWTDSICKFTNVKQDDIGLIQGDTFKVGNEFTITMIQTLVSKVKNNMREFYIKIRDAGFNLVLYDEAHKVAPGPKFAKGTLVINTKNILGLSATPWVNNNHAILMENTIGPIIAECTSYDLVPKINFIKYDSGLGKKYFNYVIGANDMLKQRARYISKLDQSLIYRQIIIDRVKAKLADGHKIIIIVFTKKLVEAIVTWLNSAGIKARPFYAAKKKIDKDNDDVIVATYSFAGAGFDMKRLSYAMIATPLSGRKSLIQVIGRILREFEGKVAPEVDDLVDIGFHSMFTKDIEKKEKILRDEFNCEFNTVKI